MGALVNTGKEQECTDTGEEQDDYGDRDDTDDGDGEGKDQETSEAGGVETDVEKPEIVPAQPEQGDQAEEPVEVIENPYREHLDQANKCLKSIQALLEEAKYSMAYRKAVELADALHEAKKIQDQKDMQIDGQMELGHYEKE